MEEKDRKNRKERGVGEEQIEKKDETEEEKGK